MIRFSYTNYKRQCELDRVGELNNKIEKKEEEKNKKKQTKNPTHLVCLSGIVMSSPCGPTLISHR